MITEAAMSQPQAQAQLSVRNGRAAVDFYNQRFSIGFSTEERADLVAFLRAL